MYQVVWLRMLSRTTGVSIHATATVVAAFMAGLALGSFVLGKLVDKGATLSGCTRCWSFLWRPRSFSFVRIRRISPFYGFCISEQRECCCHGIRNGLRFFCDAADPTAFMGGTLPVMTTYLVRKDNLLGKNLSILYWPEYAGRSDRSPLKLISPHRFFREKITTYIGIAITSQWVLLRCTCSARTNAPAFPSRHVLKRLRELSHKPRCTIRPGLGVSCFSRFY